MRKYKDTPTKELKMMWESLRNKLINGGEKEEYESLYELRKEIERRKGNSLPPKDINYSDYLTD